MKPITILLADDDPDDRQLTQDAFAESRLANDLRRVGTAGAADYLRREGRFQGAEMRPGRPICSTLNMPRLTAAGAAGHQGRSRLRSIPIVVLTTSRARRRLPATTWGELLHHQPVSFEGLVDVVRVLNHYWFEIVELPETK
jgi:two-component system response regulator